MTEKSIHFLITNKTKSIPLHKVLNKERFIILEFLMVKDLKGIMPDEFLLKSTEDSPTIMKPAFFKLIKPNPYCKNSTITSDSFAICFFEEMKVDCKRTKLEILIPGQIEEGLLHYAELHFKTLGGDGYNENDSQPVNSKPQIEYQINM